MIHTAKNAGSLGFGGGKPVANRTVRKFRQRRRVHEGFPWQGRFETKEQVDEYLSGDTIVCLECGRALKNLGLHVVRLHSMAVDAYKAKFGLPWSRGLACSATSDRYRTATQRRVEESPAFAEILRHGRTQLDPTASRTRRVAPFVIREHMVNLGVTVIDGPAAGAEILRRMAQGRTVREVLRDADMPGMSWLWGYRRANPDFDAKMLAVLEAQPFPVQARGECLGARFKAAVAELFAQGYSSHRAAKTLGVTAMTTNKVMQKLRGDP